MSTCDYSVDGRDMLSPVTRRETAVLRSTPRLVSTARAFSQRCLIIAWMIWWNRNRWSWFTWRPVFVAGTGPVKLIPGQHPNFWTGTWDWSIVFDTLDSFHFEPYVGTAADLAMGVGAGEENGRRTLGAGRVSESQGYRPTPLLRAWALSLFDPLVDNINAWLRRGFLITANGVKVGENLAILPSVPDRHRYRTIDSAQASTADITIKDFTRTFGTRFLADARRVDSALPSQAQTTRTALYNCSGEECSTHNSMKATPTASWDVAKDSTPLSIRPLSLPAQFSTS
ncbi:hypothetical protein QBC35DRAFT_471564 [Podospora australis]|uniref:Uncharacterized protein n=1 Tax=Podospora australis TaxID=1536484 RepID=A0AAN6X0K7_9PEZI|nr:hypothetical protein QBC35DRAFT_471564 [Podospora australis]